MFNDLRESQEEDILIIQKVLQSFDGSLMNLAKVINRIVDFDESSNEGRFVVKAGVDNHLDGLKRTYAGLDDFLVSSDFFSSSFQSILRSVTFGCLLHSQLWRLRFARLFQASSPTESMSSIGPSWVI